MTGRSWRGLGWLASLGLLWGCSDVPKAPPRQRVDATAAARDAMTRYDTNGDGKLDANELQAESAPGSHARNR